MESEDLERLADSFEVLQALPAWDELIRFVGVHRDKIVSQMIARPLSDPVVPAYTHGMLRGMEEFVGIASKVEKTRQTQRRHRRNRELV